MALPAGAPAGSVARDLELQFCAAAETGDTVVIDRLLLAGVFIDCKNHVSAMEEPTTAGADAGDEALS